MHRTVVRASMYLAIRPPRRPQGKAYCALLVGDPEEESGDDDDVAVAALGPGDCFDTDVDLPPQAVELLDCAVAHEFEE